MIKVQDLVVLTFCLFIFYYLLNRSKESLDAVMVTNAFSDLRCISDDLPIVRLIDNKSVQCLSKSETDTENCLMRSDLAVDSKIKCNDINTHLVKEIRNKNSPVRKVYDGLEKNVNYNLLTCNPDGLNNSGHWCGKIYNVVKNEKCTSNEGKFGLWVNPCKQMPEFAALPAKGSNTFTTTRDEILQAREEGKLENDMARNKALCGGTRPCRDELTVSSGGRNAKVQCVFKNEGDGSVAIYDKRTDKKVWDSGSAGKGSAPYKVILKTDGNLVLEDKDNKPIWESGVRGENMSKLYRANLLDKSGKCVLEITDRNGKFVWQTPSQ
jgi:hypothetical protein